MFKLFKNNKKNSALVFIVCFGLFSLIKNTLDANNAEKKMYILCLIPISIWIIYNIRYVIDKFDK